jgi:hypothetical protein
LPSLPLSQLTYAIKNAAAICSQCAVERLPPWRSNVCCGPRPPTTLFAPASRRLAACLGLGSGPQTFCVSAGPRLHKTWSSQVKIIVHSPAAHSDADLIDCVRHRAHVSRGLDKASTGQDMIQPGPGSRSPSQKRTLPVQRSIRRAVGASPVQWFVSVIAAAINAPATTSVTCCRFMPSPRPPRSAHEMGASAAHSPYRCSVFSAVLPQNSLAPQAGR